MAPKKKPKSRPAAQSKRRSGSGKYTLVGLAIVAVVVGAVIGLRYFLGSNSESTLKLFARGPATAPVVLQEFSSFT